MSCELTQTAIHGYFDGELDAVRTAEFERHLVACAECKASLEQMKSLRARLRQPEFYEHASPQLHRQIRRQLGPITPDKPIPAFTRRAFLLPVLATVAVALGLTMFWFLSQSHTKTQLIASELIDAHVRSLQPGHLTDVESTDQHTVKPWFDGRLDFIPPVSDYSQQRFPLLGGRLDVVNGHRVADVVYARRKHIVNLFVWPSVGKEKIRDGSGAGQGYNWIAWQSRDMQFCLVSDVSAVDLHELKDLIGQ